LQKVAEELERPLCRQDETDNKEKEASMRSLFDETTIQSMQLRNRLVRSATWEGMCEEDGRPTKRLIDLYVTLARGGASA